MSIASFSLPANLAVSSRTLPRLAAVVLTLVALKLCLIVFHSPIIAYSNNWDFVRLASCVGLWPKDADPADKYGGRPAPVQTYIFDGDTRPSDCLRTVDLLTLKLTLVGTKLGDYFDIRRVGAVRLAIVTSLLALLILSVKSAALRWFFCLSFALVYSDISNASFFNTLYADFSPTVGMLTLVCAACALRDPRTNQLGIMLALGAGAFLLALSKQQYTYLASVLLVFVAIYCIRTHSRWLTLGCLAAALIGPSVYDTVSDRQTGIAYALRYANNTDTFLGAVLPNASDVPQALRVLGLPESCAAGIGHSWYSPVIAAKGHPCPEIATTTRARLIPLFLLQPTTLVLPIVEAVRWTRPWYIGEYGHVEEQQLLQSPVYRTLQLTSPSSLFDKMPLSLYVVGLVTSALSALGVGVLTAFKRGFRRPWHTEGEDSKGGLALAVVLGGSVAGYSLFSAVFGDGYAGLAHHTVLLQNGLMIQIAAALVALARAADLTFLSVRSSSFGSFMLLRFKDVAK